MKFTIALGLITVASGATTLANEEPLEEAEFIGLHAELVPEEGQKWASIPWITSLGDGQNLAASEGKPLFIWAMDGHPLGCV